MEALERLHAQVLTPTSVTPTTGLSRDAPPNVDNGPFNVSTMMNAVPGPGPPLTSNTIPESPTPAVDSVTDAGGPQAAHVSNDPQSSIARPESSAKAGMKPSDQSTLDDPMELLHGDYLSCLRQLKKLQSSIEKALDTLFIPSTIPTANENISWSERHSIIQLMEKRGHETHAWLQHKLIDSSAHRAIAERSLGPTISAVSTHHEFLFTAKRSAPRCPDDDEPYDDADDDAEEPPLLEHEAGPFEHVHSKHISSLKTGSFVFDNPAEFEAVADDQFADDERDAPCPLFRHENGASVDVDPDEAPLFRHESMSPVEPPLVSFPRSRKHRQLDHKDVNDPSLEPFPTDEADILARLQRAGTRNRDDNVVFEGTPPSPLLTQTKSFSPQASVPKSTAKSKIQTITRTDSTQAASHSIGTADTEVHPLKAKASFSRSNPSLSDEPTQDEHDHAIPEIGLQVPILKYAGDVQAPTTTPLQQATPSINFNDVAPRNDLSMEASQEDDETGVEVHVNKQDLPTVEDLVRKWTNLYT